MMADISCQMAIQLYIIDSFDFPASAMAACKLKPLDLLVIR